jgi:hypothetical protein
MTPDSDIQRPSRLRPYTMPDGFVAKFWKEATQASISRLSVSLG